MPPKKALPPRPARRSAPPASRGAKPWGGRFASATDQMVEAYTSSIDVDARLLPQDIAASIAHARMLGRQRIIPRKDAAAIVRGLSEILEEYGRGAFVLRHDLEDVHMNVEARLAEKIGPAAGRLHTARSRNDQVATDFRMYVKSACSRAIAALLNLQSALLDLADANKSVAMPGYTHLQRAQPVLLAHHLLAYVQMFDRDAARFAFAHEMMDELPLGSGALAGVPYPIDRASVAAELGFARMTANSIDAVSDRDFVVDYLAAAALAFVHISRLSEELVLWSSAEFAFIRLPDAFATGSSIMPQKKNPDVAELARGRSGRAIGALVGILTTLKGLPLAYNRDLQEDKPALFSVEDALLATLDVLAAMLPKIDVDAARARKAAVANYALATDLADYLVRKGLPFREAHAAVGKLVRYAETRRVDLARLALEDFQRFSPLFAADALRIDVMASLRSRDVPGGTAPRQVTAALRRARTRVDRLNGALKEEPR
ncbi:MAG TPA: argininosuccinate lyase [Dehalococcoidia bacterium]|nr:argininosuccinate lyase [Dehalococcoidia bacterium]